MPPKAAKLIRTRAQRTPFRPGDRFSNKGRIHSRRPILSSSFFALQNGGGPYITVCRSLGSWPDILLREHSLVVLVADNPRDFPSAVVVVPDRHKFGIADVAGLVWMMESMNSDFHRSITFQRVYLKRVLYQSAL